MQIIRFGDSLSLFACRVTGCRDSGLGFNDRHEPRQWCFDSFWWKYRSILVLEIQLLLLWKSYLIYRFPTRNWGWLDHFLKKVASTDSMTSKASKPSWTWATSRITKVTKGWQFVCSITLLTSIEFSRNQKWRCDAKRD